MNSRPPHEAGDHTELDTSDFCTDHETSQYQTLIGQLQWLISLVRFNIQVFIMSMSRFRAQPRKGHLPRSKRIFGYLAYLPEGAIRFCTHKPDYSSIQEQEFDWTRFVYGNVKEHIPHTSQNHWRSLWSPPTMLRQISIMIWSLEDLSQPSEIPSTVLL